MRNRIQALVLCFIMTLLGGCGKAEAVKTENNLLKPVKTVEVEMVTLKDSLDYIGVVGAKEYTSYGSKIPGKVTSVYVEEGDSIREGDLLFEVDDEDLLTAHESAQIQASQSVTVKHKLNEALDFAKSNYERTKSLYENGAVSKAQFDEATLKIEIAQSDFDNATNADELANVNVEKLGRDLGDTKVYAMKDGLVSNVLSEAEDYISSGHPVVVVRDESLIVTMGVSSDDIHLMNLQDKVLIESSDNRGTELRSTMLNGHIAKITDDPDQETRLFEVEIELDVEKNQLDKLKIGDIVTVFKSTSKWSGVKLPLSAIQSDQFDYVFIVLDDTAIEREIDILAHFDNFVIVDGLETAEVVVIEGMRALDDKDKVKVVE